MVVDEFRLDLNFHHPFCDPREITEELLLTPWFAVKHGIKIGEVLHRETTWSAISGMVNLIQSSQKLLRIRSHWF
jgi:hypothetical protein